MKKILAVVVVLLLTQVIVSMAVATEDLERSSKHAAVFFKHKKTEKILSMMKVLGVSDPDITALVEEIDNRSKDGYLMLHQEKIADGTLSLRYALEPKINVKQVELLYAPEDSHTEYRVQINSVMMNYKLKF